MLAFLRDPAAFTAGPGLQLGDFYCVRLPGRRLYVVTDPQLVERILVGEAACFEKSRLYWGELRRSLGESMGALEGPQWERLHEVERPFFTPEAVRGYLPLVETQVRRHFAPLASGGPGARPLAVLDSLAELNARIVLSVLFGREDEAASGEIARRIADGHAIVAWRDRLPWRPALGWLNGVNRRARRHRAFFTGYSDALAGSAAASDPRWLVQALLRAAREPAAPPLPAALLCNELTFHLGAGTETQAAATSWVLYLLWKHPEALRRLRGEVTQVAGESPVSAAHVDALGYTRQVVQETLRLFPPVFAIVRDCVRPVALGGHAARVGDTFLISVCGLHRHPRLWDDPERFAPERFAPEGLARQVRHQYLPFGAGRHVCIGRHLALPGMVLTVAHLARQFDWTFPDADVRPVAGPTLKPEAPFVAQLTVRAAVPDRPR
jgi:cytochrome P450